MPSPREKHVDLSHRQVVAVRLVPERLGADDSIVKPFDPDILLAAVNAVFRRINVMSA